VAQSVIQPSSVPVDRRLRRAKSDGIDAEQPLRTLLVWLRGKPRVCLMAPISKSRLVAYAEAFFAYLGSAPRRNAFLLFVLLGAAIE
jgi:hypothetical protein